MASYRSVEATGRIGFFSVGMSKPRTGFSRIRYRPCGVRYFAAQLNATEVGFNATGPDHEALGSRHCLPFRVDFTRSPGINEVFPFRAR